MVINPLIAVILLCTVVAVDCLFVVDAMWVLTLSITFYVIKFQPFINTIKEQVVSYNWILLFPVFVNNVHTYQKVYTTVTWNVIKMTVIKILTKMTVVSLAVLTIGYVLELLKDMPFVSIFSPRQAHTWNLFTLSLITYLPLDEVCVAFLARMLMLPLAELPKLCITLQMVSS